MTRLATVHVATSIAVVVVLAAQCRVSHAADSAAAAWESADDWAPVLTAAYRGHADELHRLLRSEDSDAAKSATTSDGRNVLHLAAQQGHVDVARECLLAGISAASIDQHGRTALHVAAAEGHVEALQALLTAAPVSANLLDMNGQSAFHVAVSSGHTDAVLYLLHNADDTAALTGWSDVRLRTPLHDAALHGFTDIVKELLERGAYADQPDQDGVTPLDEAEAGGHEATAQLLRAVGGAPKRTYPMGDEGVEAAPDEPLHDAHDSPTATQ